MNLLDLQADPAAFRDSLLIDTDAGPQPFAERMDDWQRADFLALDSGWKRAVLGADEIAQYQRGWLERGRGHSKSLDLAVMATWALFASRRRLSLIGCAADIDQARLLRDAIGKLVFVNPWLGKLLEVQNYRVLNTRTESSLDIISSDAKSSYGLTPDGIICDEVVHWKNRDLWDSVLSSAAKRSTCMLVVISNAGLSGDEWQWQTREAVRQDSGWYFSRLDGPKASWITADRLAEQARLLPSIAYRRLWLNEWTSGGGDALTPEVLAAAFLPNLRPLHAAIPGLDFVAGLDLGVSRDASALTVLGVRRAYFDHGLIQMAYTKVWRPTKGTKVDLQEVEDTLVEVNERFQLKQVMYDPWQATHMSQRLQAGGMGKLVHGADRRSQLPMVEVPSTQKHLQLIATACLEAFNDRRLALYEDADLRRDLSRMRVEERPTGFRLTFPRDSLGHGDLGQSFLYALYGASDLASRRQVVLGAVTEGYGFGGNVNTPLARAHRQLAYQAERFQKDQEAALKERRDQGDRATWLKWMKQLGRA